MADIFKDILPSILVTKEAAITPSNEKEYDPYITNRGLSFYYDCVLFANEMNKSPHTDALLQYHYLLNTVRPYKRPFQKWLKRETLESLGPIKEYYNCSDEKAREYMMVLTEGQIQEIKTRIDRGGLKNDKSRRIGMGGAS